MCSIISNSDWTPFLSSTGTVSENSTEKVVNRAMNQIMLGKSIKTIEIKDEENLLKLYSFKIKKNGLPPVSSHYLPYDESSDALISELKKNNLFNKQEDRVKVIMVPSYLDGSDGLFDISYYEIINSCQLGLFPSYYEPWGYTPLESLAFGVPALTTTESGFGKFMQDKLAPTHQGLFLTSWKKTIADTSESIFESMRNYVTLNSHARILCKMNAHKLAKFADWKNLIHNYVKAHNDALLN